MARQTVRRPVGMSQFPRTALRVIVGSLAKRIRAHVNRTVIEPARRAGKTEALVVANEVHTGLRLENRMPAVCAALDAQVFQDRYDVVLAQRTGPKQSSTVTWRFSLRR